MDSPPRAPKWLWPLGLLVIGFAAWIMMRSYTTRGAAECRSLYRAARTAADTAWVDTTITPGSRAHQEPHTCGFMRTSARWQ